MSLPGSEQKALNVKIKMAAPVSGELGASNLFFPFAKSSSVLSDGLHLSVPVLLSVVDKGASLFSKPADI